MSKRSCVMYLCAAVAACAAGEARAEGLVAPRLTLDPSVLTLADEASPPAAFMSEEWMKQVKNPIAGLSWGADERMRLEYFNNAVSLNEQAANHENNFFRYRTRIWASVSPFGNTDFLQNLSINARLEWEGRHYQNPEPPEWNNGQCTFDIANLKFTVPPLATTWTIGRQEIILGDGWLVLEGTPLDGSTTIYFDAVRSTTELKDLQTSVDLMYIGQFSSPDQWLPTLGDTDKPLIENNERGVIAYVTNKSIPNVDLSPYFMYKHDRAVLGNGDNADLYTVGARVVDAFTDNLKGKIEGAYQFGSKDGASVSAWGLNGRLTYAFNDSLSNELRLNFEYLSGDNPNSAQNEEFDPLWGRWPQWSELFVYTDVRETRVAQTTNLIRVGPEYVVKPISEVELSLRYNALFANQNSDTAFINEDGYFRGHLFSAIMRYKLNSHLSAHLWAEYLVPGNYYNDTNRDNAVYVRAELFLTF
jgi:hypothetical protein